MLRLVFLAFAHYFLAQDKSSHISHRNSDVSLPFSPLDDDYYCQDRSTVEYARLASQCEQTSCTVEACTIPENITETDRGFECARTFCEQLCAVSDRALDGCPTTNPTVYAIFYVVIICLVIAGSAICYCCWRRGKRAGQMEAASSSAYIPAPSLTDMEPDQNRWPTPNMSASPPSVEICQLETIYPSAPAPPPSSYGPAAQGVYGQGGYPLYPDGYRPPPNAGA
jgi:hypothetical protein